MKSDEFYRHFWKVKKRMCALLNKLLNIKIQRQKKLQFLTASNLKGRQYVYVGNLVRQISLSSARCLTFSVNGISFDFRNSAKASASRKNLIDRVDTLVLMVAEQATLLPAAWCVYLFTVVPIQLTTNDEIDPEVDRTDTTFNSTFLVETNTIPSIPRICLSQHLANQSVKII